MIYARQIAPECQESPLFLAPEFFPADIAVCGNRRYHEHKPAVFERVEEVLEAGELAEAIADLDHRATGGTWAEWYPNVTAAIKDLLSPEKPRYSSRDIHALKLALSAWEMCTSSTRDDVLCQVLSIVTGQEWAYRTITGTCQGDWQTVYYPVNNWSTEALDEFEVEYFNTGSEWIVYDGDSAPDGPDDIEGWGMYCHGWSDEEIRTEIAQAAGESDPAAVVLYAFDGYIQTPKYREVI